MIILSNYDTSFFVLFKKIDDLSVVFKEGNFFHVEKGIV